MKLADVHILVNGHILGPFVTVLPQDARGEDIELHDGDSVVVVIAPKSSGTCLRGKAKLTKVSK